MKPRAKAADEAKIQDVASHEIAFEPGGAQGAQGVLAEGEGCEGVVGGGSERVAVGDGQDDGGLIIQQVVRGRSSGRQGRQRAEAQASRRTRG